MAIQVLKQERKQQNLLLVFFILLILIVFVIISGIFRRREIFMSPTPTSPQKIKTVEINFDILSDPRLKELETFEEISLPEEIGRENPFLPYPKGGEE